jgi:hypothetical protein
VIAAAALCPCPPLLAAELTGQADILPELRSACAAAVALLTAADPDVLVVIGPDERTGPWPADGRLDIAAYAPALARATPAGGGRFAAAARRPALPLSLGIGALLLDEAGYAGPRAFHAIDASAPPGVCLALGREVAATAPRVALLAMGDGSARRSVSAPGYLDDRAAPFDAAVERAVRDGDLPALANLDPALATDLMVTGRPAWQALAGALPAAPPRTEIRYSAAPLGVAYLVASLEPHDAAPQGGSV